MMSICLTWFPNRVLGPIYTIIWKILQECGGFTWRVSDCEELVGVTHINVEVFAGSLQEPFFTNLE